jgi:hypothetical protein
VQTKVFAPKTNCLTLIPSEWRDPIPDSGSPVKGASDKETLDSWILFGVSQSEKKRQEYQRKEESLGIIERCQKRDNEAIEKAKPKFLGIF